MIIAQDEIVVKAQHLSAVEALFQTHYREAAEARGMRFQSLHVSPPVAITEAPVTLWLRWTIADPAAWWVMRAQSGTKEVANFWAAVDKQSLSRRRTYLMEPDAAELTLPGAERSTAASRGYRETAQLQICADSADVLQQALSLWLPRLPGLASSELGSNLAPEYAAGHLTLDLLYPDASTAARAQASDVWQRQILPELSRNCSAVHALALETVGAGLREPDLAGGIKRTAFFRLQSGRENTTAEAFERDLLAMPHHIREIRNWRLSRAVPVDWQHAVCAPWTWVWEQEFRTVDDLLGPYMVHPHHWAHIDRWFDPESGAQAIDTALSHAFSPFGSSVLARELVEQGEGI
ncbi:Dabb family protein [Haliea sp.]|uniref:Dabb family protein n=1 Tax=Haliea sp. TaxID=1932666 RepID=UPI0035280E3B